ncbi:S-formylglutathione hydrolase [Pararhizobium haloflavum]|uniref:S-formylglutathione hydrolase n=1 Tax=Pararhizobium haloflavum TaxID=2037914 RepID=UPI000C1A3997|nr:S-formylglutathione hydrolase [Pararhizobium haloflavum]
MGQSQDTSSKRADGHAEGWVAGAGAVGLDAADASQDAAGRASLAPFQLVSRATCFGGEQLTLAHHSETTGTRMQLSVFVPPGARSGHVPVLYYLSGLTCTEENFTVKAGAQRMAAELGLIVVAPDTSPRGGDVPDSADNDLGQGAGFYVDATQAPWATNFRMYSYVAHELPDLIEAVFAVREGPAGICGHSMGGHGALTIAMRNPDRFRSVSAFAPIVAPSAVPWGRKAFAAYLGQDERAWQEHDATHLVRRRGFPTQILIDQGGADPFLDAQLQTSRFIDALKENGQSAKVRMHPGYDHSYFFVASFIEDHLRHHARLLQA